MLSLQNKHNLDRMDINFTVLELCSLFWCVFWKKRLQLRLEAAGDGGTLRVFMAILAMTELEEGSNSLTGVQMAFKASKNCLLP